MRQKLIALIGYKGAGKTTAAGTLMEYGFTRSSFADPMKRMLVAIGLETEDLWGADKEKPNPLLLGRTPRHAMQTLATEWGRQLMDQNIWVAFWKKSIEGLPAIVVDDMRFPNEHDAVKALGGEVWRIERPGWTGDGDTHASEALAAKLPADRVIEAESGHIRLLSEQVYAALKAYEKAGDYFTD